LGEIFEKTSSKTPLSWTGERLTDGAGKQVEIEHLHRYLLARSLCRGLDVLDVASGEGYGCAFLAQTANSVVGVELDPTAVEHARASYTQKNLSFILGDARRLPLGDCSVDVVVSFETLEHFYEHNLFVAEVRRVLRPGGQFIVSSPDRDVYSPAGQPPNPFHVHELAKAEFVELLQSVFENVALFGQRPLLGSALISDSTIVGESKDTTITFERRGDNRFEASEGLPRAVYLVAVASDRLTASIPNSLYIDSHTVEHEAPAAVDAGELNRLSCALSEAGAYARHVKEELHHKDEQIESLEAASEKAATNISHVAAELHRKNSEVSNLEEALLIREGELSRRNEEIASEKERSEALSERLADLQETLATRSQSLKAGIVARDHALSQSNQTGKRLRAEQLAASQMLAGTTAHLQQLEEHLRHAQAQQERESEQVRQFRIALETKSFELGTILSSSSWRITQPVRAVLGSNLILRQSSRRFAKVIWWTLTLQLPARLIQRWRARSSPQLQNEIAASAISLGRLTSKEVGIDLLDVALSNGPRPDNLLQGPAAFDLKAHFTRQAKIELREFSNSGEVLSFPGCDSPDITVVIVIWNQAHLTLRCLRALHAQIGPSIEVVVVDNASTDETPSLLAQVQGVNVISNLTNEGFLLGCNRGAAVARGRTLLLLNSDAFVRDGALNAALGALDADETIGAVGGKLVLPTGMLQEAGSIIWSDASTIAYGRGAHPDAGEVMFRRDVDYCSGAFLLTPRQLWERLNGFDPRYVPAYYEEADYCMRLREEGYRTVYEPEAIVDHFEFGSEKTSGDAFVLSMRNRKGFRRRHSESLLRHHLPNHQQNMLTARQRMRRGQKRLLVIDNEVPLVSLGSGYPRAVKILREASANWAVTFYPLHQLEVDWGSARKEIPKEIEIISDMAVLRLAEFLETRRGFYDTIVVSRPDNMNIVRDVLRIRPHLIHGVRLVYDAEALFSARDIARSRFEGKPLSDGEIETLTSSEVALAGDADVITCVTEMEAEVFRSRQTKPVVVLSHPHSLLTATPSFDSRSGFLFVGRLLEREAPNWIGLSWFIRECWPLIRSSLPEATLFVVGRIHEGHEELAQPGVHLVGPVAELEPFYNAARVFVSPIQFAAGVPIKIIDATSAGMPTVGTRLMSTLLGWQPQIDILTEDDPAAFATAALCLHEEVELWEATRAAAAKRLEQEHGPTLFRERLNLTLDGAGTDSVPQAHQRDDAHRVARVEAIWSKPVPTELADQWSKYPLSHPTIQAAMNRRATGLEGRDPYVHLMMRLKDWGFNLPIGRAASLCCGAGALERRLFKLGMLENCVGFDLSSGAVEQALEAAQNEGLTGLDYKRRDLEHDGLGVGSLELVLAHQGVHHLSRLEAVFDAVHDALVPGGIFHLHEFVGPDRFQWPDRQVEEMTTWLRSVPESYRTTSSGVVKDCAGRATLEEMMSYDPSEAVRSSAIDSLVSARFEIVERHLIGGNLAMMALADIGHNFDPASKEAKGHLDRLLAREEELIAAKELRSDFAIIVARKKVPAAC
jgi:GT2 family glycosyltransferase/SAM-dependent methyltransferase